MSQSPTEDPIVAKRRSLLEGIVQGDERSFRQLVGETHQDVYRICMAILHHHEEAEEVTQEVYIRLHQQMQKEPITAEGCFFWLRQVATRASIDRLRSLKRRLQRLNTYFSDFLRPSAPSNADTRLTLKETLKALEQLPEGQQVAFSLYTMGGLSCEQIAALQETTEKAIEQRIVRARRSLRHKLQR